MISLKYPGNYATVSIFVIILFFIIISFKQLLLLCDM